jgi:hypothetical protein
LGVAVLVAGTLASVLAGGASSAESVVFRDTRGNVLTVDAAAGTYEFRSGTTIGFVGSKTEIRPGRRFAFKDEKGGKKLIANVDLALKRASVTVVQSGSNRWLASMVNAGTTVMPSPTATAVPAPDAYRVVVTDGALLSRPGQAFSLDVFRNGKDRIHGKLVYKDPLSKVSFVAEGEDAFTVLTVGADTAHVEGRGTYAGRGTFNFVLDIAAANGDDDQSMRFRLQGNVISVDGPFEGVLKMTAKVLPQATPTATRTPTRVPTYTPTPTRTPLPTSTPVATWTPTRAPF